MAILLCYDGFASAQRAVGVAHQTLGHRAITLLHVWSAPMEFLADASFGTTSARLPSVADLERFSLERAQTITQEGPDLASNPGLAVETRIERSQA
nr:hypothetical protein [Actinomycetota bacterium]